MKLCKGECCEGGGRVKGVKNAGLAAKQALEGKREG